MIRHFEKPKRGEKKNREKKPIQKINRHIERAEAERVGEKETERERGDIGTEEKTINWSKECRERDKRKYK